MSSEPDAHVAAQRQRRAHQRPLLAARCRSRPTRRATPSGTCSAMWARLRAFGRMPPGDAHHARDLQRRVEQAHVEQRVEVGDVARVEALVLGLDALPRASPCRSSMIVSNEFSNTALNTKSLRRREYFA